MPLYEYRCRQCARHYEKIQKFSEPPLKTCPTCGGPLERLLSAPAIQFKGSGWYVTDYARKSSPAEVAKPEKPAASSDDKKPSEPPKGKEPAETKPASKQ